MDTHLAPLEARLTLTAFTLIHFPAQHVPPGLDTSVDGFEHPPSPLIRRLGM